MGNIFAYYSQIVSTVVFLKDSWQNGGSSLTQSVGWPWAFCQDLFCQPPAPRLHFGRNVCSATPALHTLPLLLLSFFFVAQQVLFIPSVLFLQSIWVLFSEFCAAVWPAISCKSSLCKIGRVIVAALLHAMCCQFFPYFYWPGPYPNPLTCLLLSVQATHKFCASCMLNCRWVRWFRHSPGSSVDTLCVQEVHSVLFFYCHYFVIW